MMVTEGVGKPRRASAGTRPKLDAAWLRLANASAELRRLCDFAATIQSWISISTDIVATPWSDGINSVDIFPPTQPAVSHR